MQWQVGRLDILTSGNNINFSIIENKQNIKAKAITWYKEKTGIFLNELPLEGSFVLQAHEDMQLTFDLKGIDQRDFSGKMLEKWCTFTSFCLNGKNLLSAPVRVWHSKGHTVSYSAKKDEKIQVKFKYEGSFSDLMVQMDLLQEEVQNLKYSLGTMFWKSKNIKILSQQETINEIIDKNLSIARYGDGEVRWMLVKGFQGRFQKYDEKLAKRLLEVFSSNDPHLMVCLAGPFSPFAYRSNYWEQCVRKILFDLVEVIKPNQIFGDTDITRNANNVPLMKTIWQGKDIVMVEGDKSRVGVGNDLFDNVNSIKRILCPAENAFDCYDKILEECLKMSKNHLFLISLGPTATVLAYDLCRAGHRALDVGHIDICYEWKLRGAKEKILIPGKYVNEVEGGNRNVAECTDEKYLQSIIAKIA